MLLPRYRYPSDTSDLEWALLKDLLPTPACQTPKGGAPEKWPRRCVVDAIPDLAWVSPVSAGEGNASSGRSRAAAESAAPPG